MTFSLPRTHAWTLRTQTPIRKHTHLWDNRTCSQQLSLQFCQLRGKNTIGRKKNTRISTMVINNTIIDDQKRTNDGYNAIFYNWKMPKTGGPNFHPGWLTNNIRRLEVTTGITINSSRTEATKLGDGRRNCHSIEAATQKFPNNADQEN